MLAGESDHCIIKYIARGAHADDCDTQERVIRTCQKNGLNFLEYGPSVLRAQAADGPLPLPLDSD